MSESLFFLEAMKETGDYFGGMENNGKTKVLPMVTVTTGKKKSAAEWLDAAGSALGGFFDKVKPTMKYEMAATDKSTMILLVAGIAAVFIFTRKGKGKLF